MKVIGPFLLGVLVAAFVLAPASLADAETCTLKLKRLEPAAPRTATSTPDPTILFRRTTPQRFYSQSGTTTRLMSTPAVHTLETHFRGNWQEGAHDGEYYDENLMTQDDTKPVRVTSLAHKSRLLKERGLHEKGTHRGRTEAKKHRHYSIGETHG